MKELEKAYRKSLTANMFYEQTEHGRKIGKTSLTTADEFYENLIHIHNDDDAKLIFESHHDAQFNKSLINKIFNAQNYTQIDADDVFRRCSSSIKSNYVICRNLPIYIFDFSFSKNPQMINTIFSHFNLEFSLKEGTLKEKYDYETNRFIEECGNDSGECIDLENCALLLFNSDKKIETTVVHELYHYLQMILKKERHELEDIKKLQLNIDNLEYLFDDYEFETHIKVNLVNQLEEMYWKFYKNDMTKNKFIDKFISKVQSDPLNVVQMFFNKLIDMKNNDSLQLRLFAACFEIRNKQYLLDAIKWLKETFR